MIEPNDASYYAKRERQERAFATAAKDPEIKAIHLDLARRYAALALEGARVELVRSSASKAA